MMLTRREACIVLGALGAGALGIAGCGSSNSDKTSRIGYGQDAEVKSYPVHLKLYLDSQLQWNQAPKRGSKEPLGQIDTDIQAYNLAADRADVSIELAYLDLEEILVLVHDGFPDGDGLIAMNEAILDGAVYGTLEVGSASLYVRKLSHVTYTNRPTLVRAIGSDANLPPAATATGKNSPSGDINQFQQLPIYDGKIALADPVTTLDGRIANTALASERFYLEGAKSQLGGLLDGHYREDITNKLIIYPNQDAAMAAVVAGECQMGFALSKTYQMRYPGVEKVCELKGSAAQYSATNFPNSAEPGVARDFFSTLVE